MRKKIMRSRGGVAVIATVVTVSTLQFPGYSPPTRRSPFPETQTRT